MNKHEGKGKRVKLLVEENGPSKLPETKASQHVPNDELAPQFLAMLAARLAIHNETPDAAVQRALDFLDAAEAAIQKRKRPDEWALNAEWAEMHADIPKPESFPITFDEFLRYALPKMCEADRCAEYRKYLKFKNPDADPSVLLAKKRARDLNEDHYLMESQFFKDGRANRISNERRKAAGLRKKNAKSLDQS